MSLTRKPKQTVRDEEQRAVEFFGLDEYETPEIDRGLHFPEGQGLDADNRLKIPYVVPRTVVEHEARHITHFNVAEQVIDENLDEVKEFYDSEFRDLETGGLHLNGLIDSAFRDEIEVPEDLAGLDAGELNELLIETNYATSNQPENYANNTALREALPTAVFGAGMALIGKTTAHNLDYIQEAMANQPAELALPAVTAAVFTAGAGLSAASTYDAMKNEPLTDDNLEPYSEDERKVAMLYNDNVAPTIEEFLDVAGSYGIE